VGKPEGRRPLGRPRRRWEDNIKMDFREVGLWAMEWTDVALETSFDLNTLTVMYEGSLQYKTA
jgi:hypothetical protein